MNNEKGFSLIELVIVIAMIGILSAIAVPGIKTWITSHRVSSVVLEIRSALQRAKTAAIKDQTTVAIEFVTGSPGSYRVFVDDGITPRTYDAGELILVSNTFNQEVTIYNVNFNGGTANTTQFNSMGLASGFDGDVSVRDSGSSIFKRVSLTNAGNITIEKSTNGTIWTN